MWQQDATPKLFFIVLDGCSYPVFSRVAASVGQRQLVPAPYSTRCHNRLCDAASDQQPDLPSSELGIP